MIPKLQVVSVWKKSNDWPSCFYLCNFKKTIIQESVNLSEKSLKSHHVLIEKGISTLPLEHVLFYPVSICWTLYHFCTLPKI